MRCHQVFNNKCTSQVAATNHTIPFNKSIKQTDHGHIPGIDLKRVASSCVLICKTGNWPSATKKGLQNYWVEVSYSTNIQDIQQLPAILRFRDQTKIRKIV